MSNADPFLPQDQLVVVVPSDHDRLRWWLDANGFDDVTFQVTPLVGCKSILLACQRPHRADEACYAVMRADILPAGVQVIDLDEFARIMLAQRAIQFRHYRTAGWSPRAWFWMFVYAFFPRFGEAP